MVYVDIEKCAGCGVCAEACPVGAIILIGDTAQLDQEKCTDCEACVEACPNGAMLAIREPVAERVLVLSLRPSPEASPRRQGSAQRVIEVSPRTAPAPLRTNLVPLIDLALNFLGRQVVPRLAPNLINALDRRLGGQAGLTTRGRGFRRRRRRGGGPQGR